MVTNELVNNILLGRDPNFDEADQAAILWQYQPMSGFHRALWTAIEMADQSNLRKLSAGFPVEVQGYINWTKGSLAQRLRIAGEEADNEKEAE